MRLGLSTSWNASHHASGREMIFEILGAGFATVELGFNLTASMVEEIASLRKAGKVEVASLHNYCPIPDGLTREQALPDRYSIASLDDEERGSAVTFTRRTIETAASLGARAVVLHAGRVEIPDRTRQLIELQGKGPEGSAEAAFLREAMVKERGEKAAQHLDRLLKSLDELNRAAETRSIKLGIETRFYYREIPGFDEIGRILERFRGGSIFYWHDTGHAQLMETLSFYRHKDLLDAYASDLLGIHLHDIRACQDHLPPPGGEIDFRMVGRYLSPSTITILEAHQPASAGDLAASRSFLEEALRAA